jgi:hypothetical protein
MLADVIGGNLVWIGLLAVVPLWAIIDAMGRPALAFYAAGWNKSAWVLVLVLFMFLGLGLFLGAYYLFSVRQKVRQATV